ncbi:MAG: cytochrome c [Vicinamibacterales bacterium]
MITRNSTTGRRAVGALAVLAATVALGGCRNDMQRGPRYDPLTPSDFFTNGAASRTPVEGTVARGQLHADSAFYTGKVNGQIIDKMPVDVTAELVARGQNRFNVYCSPCHSRLGNGQGMAVQRGVKQPTSYHDPRLRNERDGYFFDVITNGFGQMQDYSAQIQARDRWAIVAYIRALQLSQNATVADVPAADRSKLDTAQGGPAAEGAGHEGANRHE